MGVFVLDLCALQVETVVERLLHAVSLGAEFKDGTRTKSSLWSLFPKLAQALTEAKDADTIVQLLGDVVG